MSLLHLFGLAKLSDVYRLECVARRADVRASVALAKAREVEAEFREFRTMVLHPDSRIRYHKPTKEELRRRTQSHSAVDDLESPSPVQAIDLVDP